MKHELGGQIMKKFVGLTCSYIKDKKEKELTFRNYKSCIEPSQLRRKPFRRKQN